MIDLPFEATLMLRLAFAKSDTYFFTFDIIDAKCAAMLKTYTRYIAIVARNKREDTIISH